MAAFAGRTARRLFPHSSNGQPPQQQQHSGSGSGAVAGEGCHCPEAMAPGPSTVQSQRSLDRSRELHRRHTTLLPSASPTTRRRCRENASSSMVTVKTESEPPRDGTTTGSMATATAGGTTAAVAALASPTASASASTMAAATPNNRDLGCAQFDDHGPRDVRSGDQGDHPAPSLVEEKSDSDSSNGNGNDNDNRISDDVDAHTDQLHHQNCVGGDGRDGGMCAVAMGSSHGDNAHSMPQQQRSRRRRRLRVPKYKRRLHADSHSAAAAATPSPCDPPQLACSGPPPPPVATDNHLRPAASFAPMALLQTGSESKVWRAFDTVQGREVCCKQFCAESSCKDDRVALVLREYAMARCLNHPHIVPHIAVALDPELPLIVQELADMDLYEFGVNHCGPTGAPPEEATRLLEHVASALQFMHAKGIAHCDVKPENVLIKDGHAMLCDFGCAGNLGLTVELCGTPMYMAPELVALYEASQPSTRFTITQSQDVFGLGLLILWLTTGDIPWHRASMKDQAYLLLMQGKHRATNPWRTMPQRLVAHLEACLCPDPMQRCTVVDVLQYLHYGFEADFAAWSTARGSMSPPETRDADRFLNCSLPSS